MKKVLTIVFSIVALIFIIILIDYSIARLNKTKPIFSIKKEDTEKQIKIYSGMFYKIYTCTADDGIYEVKSIFSKVSDNFCPKEYKIEFKNGYFINNKNIKISKDDYTKLIQFYSIEKIINMTESELKDALDEIDNLKPITN